MFDLSAGGDKLRVTDQVPQPLISELASQLRNHIVDLVRRKGTIVVSISQPHAETNHRELGVLAEEVQCFEVCNHGGVAETRCIRCHKAILAKTERGKKTWTRGSSKSSFSDRPLVSRNDFRVANAILASGTGI